MSTVHTCFDQVQLNSVSVHDVTQYCNYTKLIMKQTQKEEGGPDTSGITQHRSKKESG